MFALRAHVKGDPIGLAYEEAPIPEHDDDDVLLRVLASGVTPSELSWPTTWITYDGTPRPLPIIPGHEVVGVVDIVGSHVTDLAIGTRVYGLIDFQRDGADAEFVAARASELAPLPTTLSSDAAAAMPLSALTAWQAIFDEAQLESGERILIHGASGGVGTFAIQLARWRGAHVIASAGSTSAPLLQELGANQVIDYRAQRFEDAIDPVDVVFDTVGGETWTRSGTVLNPGGRLVSVAVPKPPDMTLTAGRTATWFVVAPNRVQLGLLADLAALGTIRPIVSQVLPLADAALAFGPGSHAPGKIVLHIADSPR